ncbi:putative protein kinase RLK-Pelle-RLCK-Os family [Rosa chinensis]|uniref:Protein kinase domain-containing protein n=1 Tax=Rosa chinensis TaxID=74649 RepID=A0A2P6QT03_ROSCH|nr:putative protein kinase RLK-Pelle-RLCK-Os family [Rosa chinensis]
MSSCSSTPPSSGQLLAIFVGFVVVFVKITLLVAVCRKRNQSRISDKPSFLTLTMDKFLNDMEREKPIRFTSQQLRIATDNFTNLLGSGGFGAVYKGIFSNGTLVAVKVLNGTSDKRIEEQFMAEHLIVGFEKLHDIAVGTARGIAYLHEECQQRIVHYDIKPENILLDVNFFPKVADFGLAKLSNRDNSHITMTGGRGTPGYAAPEVWLRFPITHKCDVYSFGMLLFEIIGRRRNLDLNLPESQDWFPRWVWKKFEAGQLGELMLVCGIEEKDKEIAERMVKVAIWCVQYRHELRPLMSVVVKMLEGALEIPKPSINPFQHLMPGTPIMVAYSTSAFDTDSSQTITGYRFLRGTPIMNKYEIEIASI